MIPDNPNLLNGPNLTVVVCFILVRQEINNVPRSLNPELFYMQNKLAIHTHSVASAHITSDFSITLPVWHCTPLTLTHRSDWGNFQPTHPALSASPTWTQGDPMARQLLKQQGAYSAVKGRSLDGSFLQAECGRQNIVWMMPEWKSKFHKERKG